MRIGLLMAAFLGFASLVPSARADEEKIPLDKVPAPVMKAFKAKFPKAEIKAAIKEVEDGKTTYEIESMQDGLSIDCVLKPDGDFVEIERQIKLTDLPKAVSDAVATKYPKSKSKKAEEVTKDDQTTYEVTVEKADGKTVVVAVDKAGKVLEEEKD